MRKLQFISVIVIVFLIIVAVCFQTATRAQVEDGGPLEDGATSSPATIRSAVLSDLTARARETGFVKVIIELRFEGFRPVGEIDESQRGEQASRIAAAQEQFLSSYRTTDGIGEVKRFEYIPFVAAEVDAGTIDLIKDDPNVAAVLEDLVVDPTLAQSVAVVGAPDAWNSGFTGSGWAVAVLDTGVDKNHSFLTGKVISEACYSSNLPASNVTSVCPGGVTQSTAPNSGLNCSSTISGCDHGTHVAGISAGTSAQFSGVARGGNIVAVQVFSRFANQSDCAGNPPCARTYFSDVTRGLERVLTLSSTTNIAAANMSLGGGRFIATCDTGEMAPVKAAIDNLRSVGIASVIASGNESFTNAMGAPGCISTAISVGATGDGSGGAGLDQVQSYSNSASFLKLLAPGSLINSSVPGGFFSNFNGTSMAAPHVAGAWAILKQRAPTASVTEVLNALTTTGLSVTDSRNGIVKPRIRINNALQVLGGGCTYSLDPPSRSFSSTAASSFVNVVTQTGCAWSASVNAPGAPQSIFVSDIASLDLSVLDPVEAPEVSFVNSTPITINDRTSNANPPGTASPYPSNIAVSGMTGNITQVDVTLNGISHTFPDDVDVVLVGPGGQRAILMSDAGGDTDILGLTLTFNQSAGSLLPDASQIFSGTFRPTNFIGSSTFELGGIDNFPAPGPGQAAHPSDLSVFNGTAPNGTWSLYVTDDENFDSGTISGGWSVNVTTGGGPSWINITSASNGSGSGAINYIVGQNSNATPRNGTITLNGTIVHSISQGGSGSTSTPTNTPTATPTNTPTATPTATPPQGACSFSNGGLNPGSVSKNGVAAPTGFFWSEVQNTAGNLTESNTNAGVTVTGGSFRLADNFTLTQTCTLQSVAMYAYLTGAPATPSPFTAATLRIWNGRPGDVGATVVFGNTTTNRLVSSVDSTFFRIFNTVAPPPGTAPGTTRKLWRNTLTINTMLPPGNYWFDWDTTVTGAATHFAPSKTLEGLRGAPGDNARQLTVSTGVWIDVIDAGNPATALDFPQDFPFDVVGTGSGTPTPTNTPTATPTATPGPGCAASYTGPAVAIPDSPTGGINVNLPVSGIGTISDLNFRFDGTPSGVVGDTNTGVDHTFVGDLRFRLTSPLGTSVTFFDQPGVPDSTFGCGSNNLAQLILDDDGGFASVENQCGISGEAAFPSGVFSPNSPLSAFDGENPNGNWTLNVTDLAGTDVGSVRRFSLLFNNGICGATSTPTSTPTPTATPTNTPTATPTATPTPTGTPRVRFDYDGDRKADVSVYRPSTGVWYLDRSLLGFYGIQFGFGTDKIVPADYDGDGKFDVGVYRPSTGVWYWVNSQTLTYGGVEWGIPGDIPVPGDYDGDGRADQAVFRPSTGQWWLNRTRDGVTVVSFGVAGDHPVVGDYDGDGRADQAIFRPSTGVWWLNRSRDGVTAIAFGFGTDKVVPADYDNDGKTDVAVYRPSTGVWYWANSQTLTYGGVGFGAPGDIPAAGDYDGDGRADAAIYRPSTRTWWLNRTTDGVTTREFGLNGDIPTPNAYGN